VLVALPPNVTVAEFTDELRRAIQRETFVNRRLLAEPVADTAGSVFYNADAFRHSDRAPVVYVHPPLSVEPARC
jgi:hypothetical protein